MKSITGGKRRREGSTIGEALENWLANIEVKDHLSSPLFYYGNSSYQGMR